MLFKYIKIIFFMQLLFIPITAEVLIQKNENNHSTELISSVPKQWLGDFNIMKKKRIIRVLVVPSKIMYTIIKGKESGIAYELGSLFEKHINKHYSSSKNNHIKIHVIFIPTTRDKLFSLLNKGYGDIIISDLAITPQRQKIVDFSEPLFSNIDEIVVTNKSVSTVKTLKDLAGKEIYVRPSSSYNEYLKKLNTSFSKMNLSSIHIKSVPEILEDEDIMDMVNANLIPITIVDNYKAKLWSKMLPDIKLYENIALKKNDHFALIIRKSSPQFMKEINTFVQTHKEGTLLGNILRNRYVKNYSPVNNALTKKELHKFHKIMDIFKKHASEYNLDYLLMLAQGYQESKLNQDAKSAVGSIGIMQLMPETGKSMKVGDIRKIKSNIHAGIKYHRWLINRYFKDDNITNLNKTLFTFAAYNAGPAKVRRLRNEAKRQGLDPNKWMNNVEFIASKKIGVETVTYVSNIFKYYVSYKLYLEKFRANQEAKKSFF